MRYNEATIILRRLLEYAVEGNLHKEEIKVEAAKLLRELLKPNARPPQLPVNDLIQWLSETYPGKFSEATEDLPGKGIEDALDEFIENIS